MLLTDENKRDLVNEILAITREVLRVRGEDKQDAETGLVTRECRLGSFVLVEHQRQTLAGGEIRTNGLDLWQVDARGGRKQLSVTYVPFAIKVFNCAGRAEWIAELAATARETL